MVILYTYINRHARLPFISRLLGPAGAVVTAVPGTVLFTTPTINSLPQTSYYLLHGTHYSILCFREQIDSGTNR